MVGTEQVLVQRKEQALEGRTAAAEVLDKLASLFDSFPLSGMSVFLPDPPKCQWLMPKNSKRCQLDAFA